MRNFLLLVVILMTGCAGAPVDGPRFAPITPLPADKATVYIYYPEKAPPLSVSYAEVFINGEKKFNLGFNGYGVFTLPPGEYEIKVEGTFGTNWLGRAVTRKVVVESGREYYARVGKTMRKPDGEHLPPEIREAATRRPVTHTEITLVPKMEALAGIAETYLHQERP